MTRKELEALTIMELRTFARTHDVPLRRTWKKKEIIDAIVRMTRPKRGRKPKPVTRPEGRPSRRATLRKTNALPKKASDTSAVFREPDVQDMTAGEPVSGRVLLLARNTTTLYVDWRLDVAGPVDEPFTLRLRNLSHGGRDVYDLPLDASSGSRYIPIRQPGMRFVCELLSGEGEARRLVATSRPVDMPPDRSQPLRRPLVPLVTPSERSRRTGVVTLADLIPVPTSSR